MADWLQIAQRSQSIYRKPPSLFRMVPSLTPYGLPFPQNGLPIHMPPRYANGHISATGDPIHFMFGSTVGFSGSADRMALFPVTSNSSCGKPPSWIISNGHISATAHLIHLYSAHRAVISFLVGQVTKSLWGQVKSAFRYFCRYFHRAMHFSAKRGLAIACRLSGPSVCLSLCLSVTFLDCDHIG